VSHLAAMAAQHDAARAQAAARRNAKRTGGTPATATDPERCKAPGRTLARPAHWPDEAPSWTDLSVEATGVRPSHKATRGRRRGGWCPQCHEQRSRTGVCWCDSDQRATSRKGTPVGARSHRARDLPPEAQGPAWAQVHRAMHPQPVPDCRRCEVAHAPDD
jgi:hypothetical protein